MEKLFENFFTRQPHDFPTQSGNDLFVVEYGIKNPLLENAVIAEYRLLQQYVNDTLRRLRLWLQNSSRSETRASVVCFFKGNQLFVDIDWLHQRFTIEHISPKKLDKFRRICGKDCFQITHWERNYYQTLNQACCLISVYFWHQLKPPEQLILEIPVNKRISQKTATSSSEISSGVLKTMNFIQRFIVEILEELHVTTITEQHVWLSKELKKTGYSLNSKADYVQKLLQGQILKIKELHSPLTVILPADSDVQSPYGPKKPEFRRVFAAKFCRAEMIRISPTGSNSLESFDIQHVMCFPEEDSVHIEAFFNELYIKRQLEADLNKPIEVTLFGSHRFQANMFGLLCSSIYRLTIVRHNEPTSHEIAKLNLPCLRHLKLKQCQNVTLSSGDLDVFPELRSLELHDSSVFSIEDNVFDSLKLLKHVALDKGYMDGGWGAKKRYWHKHMQRLHFSEQYRWLRDYFILRPSLTAAKKASVLTFQEGHYYQSEEFTASENFMQITDEDN